MKTTDALFSLIHSLTYSEKRYFRQHADTGKGKKKYIMLFDAMVNQRIYDEKKLRQLLGDEKLLNELHVAKHYLFEQILKSLRGYLGGQTTYQKILKQMVDVDNLYQRGLHNLAMKRLQKTKQLAKKYHHLSLWLHTIEREQIFLSNSVVGAKQASSLKTEIEFLLDQITQKNNFDEISFAIRDAQYVTSSNRVQISKLEERILSMQEAFKPEQSDLRTIISFNKINSRFYLIKENPQLALPYLRSTVDLLDRNRHMVEEGYFNQYVALCDYFCCLHDLSFEPQPNLLKLPAMNAFIHKMERSVSRHHGKDHQVRLVYSKMEIQCLWCLFTGEHQMGLHLLQESINSIKKLKSDPIIYDELTYSFYYARFYLGLGDYKSALESINKLLASEILKTNSSMMGLARIMSLVILYELGEHSYVSHSLKSLRAFFKVHSHYPQYETLSIQALRALVSKDKKKGQDVQKKVLLKFEHLRKTRSENTRLLEFEFDWWLDSKINNIPFLDIVRRHRLS